MLSGGQHNSKTFFITRRVRVGSQSAWPMIFLADFYNCAVQQNAESPRDASAMTHIMGMACARRDANHPVSGVIASHARAPDHAPVRARAPPPTHSRAGGRDPHQYTPPSIHVCG